MRIFFGTREELIRIAPSVYLFFIFYKFPWNLVFEYLDESFHLFEANFLLGDPYFSRPLCVVSENLTNH